MVTYVDVNFNVYVTESSFLTDQDILATVCNAAEQDVAEDAKFTKQNGEEPFRKPSLSGIANAINLMNLMEK